MIRKFRRPALMAAAVMLTGCADKAGLDQEAASTAPQPSNSATQTAPVSLVSPTPVIVPGLDEETSWFGTVQELAFDTLTRNLLALDMQEGRVVEFSTGGNLVATYGGTKGRGPEEVSRLAGFAFNDSIVVLLDAGNTKTLIYSRAGEFRRILPALATYRDVALHGDQLLFVPGSDGLVDVRTLDAAGDGPIETLGDAADLPVRCQGAECATLRRLCTGCEVIAVNDSLFAIANLEQSMIATFTSDGERLHLEDLILEDPVVRRWHEQDRELIEEANAESGGRTITLKTYFFGFEPVGTWRIASAVVPSGQVFRDRGYEYWIIDLRTWEKRRLSFPEKELGLRAAGAGPVYALNRANGGIYGLGIPPGSGDANRTESTPTPE